MSISLDWAKDILANGYNPDKKNPWKTTAKINGKEVEIDLSAKKHNQVVKFKNTGSKTRRTK